MTEHYTPGFKRLPLSRAVLRNTASAAVRKAPTDPESRSRPPGPVGPHAVVSEHGAASNQLTDLRARISGGLAFECPHCDSSVQAGHLSLAFNLPGDRRDVQLFLVNPDNALEDVLDEVRRTLVSRALRDTHGNKSKAAAQLGMKYTTFYALVKRLGLEDEGRR